MLLRTLLREVNVEKMPDHWMTATQLRILPRSWASLAPAAMVGLPPLQLEMLVLLQVTPVKLAIARRVLPQTLQVLLQVLRGVPGPAPC